MEILQLWRGLEAEAAAGDRDAFKNPRGVLGNIQRPQVQCGFARIASAVRFAVEGSEKERSDFLAMLAAEVLTAEDIALGFPIVFPGPEGGLARFVEIPGFEQVLMVLGFDFGEEVVNHDFPLRLRG